MTNDPAEDRRLFVGALGLPLTGDDDYVFSEKLNGSKHFAVWSLMAASQAFFGTDSWPTDRPIPQAMVGLEVNDVAAAAQELQNQGYELLHPPQDHPWNQTAARLQNKDGSLLASALHHYSATIPPAGHDGTQADSTNRLAMLRADDATSRGRPPSSVR